MWNVQQPAGCVASVTNAAEKPFDRIPEFINPVIYNNGKHVSGIGYGTTCRKFDSIAFMW